jgi:hypothetical protein
MPGMTKRRKKPAAPLSEPVTRSTFSILSRAKMDSTKGRAEEPARVEIDDGSRGYADESVEAAEPEAEGVAAGHLDYLAGDHENDDLDDLKADIGEGSPYSPSLYPAADRLPVLEKAPELFMEHEDEGHDEANEEGKGDIGERGFPFDGSIRRI